MRRRGKKTSKTKRKTQGKNLQFVLCWPPTPEHGAWPGVRLIYPMTLHWRKPTFPVPSRRPLWITSGLRIRLWVHFSLSVLGLCLVWIRSGASHAVSLSVSSCAYQSFGSGRYSFFGVPGHSLAFTFLLPSPPHRSLSLQKRVWWRHLMYGWVL